MSERSERINVTGEADKRAKCFEMMKQVYCWDVSDGPGDFFSMTVEHLFGDVWTRQGLSMRERRLLLFGLLVGMNMYDVIGIQLEAALSLAEFTPDELREVVIFLTHYAGWPKGAKLNSQVEELIAKHERKKDPT